MPEAQIEEVKLLSTEEIEKLNQDILVRGKEAVLEILDNSDVSQPELKEMLKTHKDILLQIRQEDSTKA